MSYILYILQIYSLASQVAPVVKNPPANAGDTRGVGLIPGLGRSLEEEMAAHFSILPGKSHGQSSLEATVHEVAKNWTRLSAHACMHVV